MKHFLSTILENYLLTQQVKCGVSLIKICAIFQLYKEESRIFAGNVIR